MDTRSKAVKGFAKGKNRLQPRVAERVKGADNKAREEIDGKGGVVLGCLDCIIRGMAERF